MNHVINANRLVFLKELAYLAKLATSKPAIPILENMKVVVTDGEVELICTDLHHGLSILSKGLTSEGTFTCLLPINVATNLKKLKEDTAILELDTETNRLDIKAGKRVLTITTDQEGEENEYPMVEFDALKLKEKYKELLADWEDKEKVGTEPIFGVATYTANKDYFKSAISCRSTDEMRPQMCGTFLGRGSLVTTNGNVLYKADVTTSEVGTMLLPRAVTDLITLINPLAFEYCFLENDRAIIYIENSDVEATISAELVNERFPAFEQVLPIKEHFVHTEFTVNITELEDEITLAGDFAPESGLLQFSLQPESSELRIFTENMDWGKSYDGTIPVSAPEKDEENMLLQFSNPVGISKNLLLTIIKTMPKKSIVTVNSFGITKPWALTLGNEYFLIMPMIVDPEQLKNPPAEAEE